MSKVPLYIKSPLKVFGLEFLSGLFFLSAVVILIYFTAVINGADWISGRNRLHLTVAFHDVGDLGTNSKVCYRGMQIGRVSKMGMAEDYSCVNVLVSLDEKIEIYRNYSVTVRQSSVFGGSYLAIDAGSPDSTTTRGVVTYDTILQGAPPTDLLHDATELVSALRKDEQIFRKEFLEGELLENLVDIPPRIAASADAFRSLVDEVRYGSGSVSRLIADSGLYTEFKETLHQLHVSARQLNTLSLVLSEGRGTLPRLLKDSAFYDEMIGAVRQFRTTMDDVKPAAVQFGAFTQQLMREDGSLNQLMTDKGELYSALRRTLEGSDAVMRDIRYGQGTLGLFMRDSALYDEAKNTFYQLRGAIEDFREQAPIMTFGSLMMGAL